MSLGPLSCPQNTIRNLLMQTLLSQEYNYAKKLENLYKGMYKGQVLKKYDSSAISAGRTLQ